MSEEWMFGARNMTEQERYDLERCLGYPSQNGIPQEDDADSLWTLGENGWRRYVPPPPRVFWKRWLRKP